MRLPERLTGPGDLLLRRLVPADAEALERTVTESLEHLRPWMPWIAQEPLALERRRALLADWEAGWEDGGDVYMGVFAGGELVGGTGLHRRIGPGGIEIGYWIHPGHLRRGLATEAARLLTEAALAHPGITHVEIHHDEANRRSAGVPRKLGFRLVAVEPDRDPTAPAESGVECRWRITAAEWRDLHPTPPGARLGS